MPITATPEHAAACEKAARAGGRVLREWVGRFSVSQKGPRDLVTEADHAAQREIRGLLREAFPDYGFIGEEDDGGGPRPASGHAGHSGTGVRWIVDPLDGTSNYVHGFPAYCVSVALADADDLLVGTIYDPIRDECFSARRGAGASLDGRPVRVATATDPGDAIAAVSFPPRVTPDAPAVADFLAVLPHLHSVRRTGSTALNLAWLACGRLHAFWVRRIACWDVAAGMLLVREAGGVVGPFVAGTPCGETPPLDDPALIAACTPDLLTSLRGMLR